MAQRFSGGFRWLIGLILTLLAPVVVEMLGWNDPWVIIVPSALLGALCLWNINAAYAHWVNEAGRWDVRSWLSHHLTLAGAGIAVVAVAALLMAWSSTDNVQAGIAYALGLWLAGTVPVVQVVRAKLADIADAFPFALAWILNALLIAGTTVLPAGLLTGWEWSGLAVGAVAGGVWLAFEVARRLISVWPWLVGVGAFAMLLPIAFVLFAEADRVRWPLLLLLPVGLALVSARQRGPRPVAVGPTRADPWKITALAAVVLLIVGFVWWLVVIGDDVSTTLVFAGALGSLLFGASLVTRGEGLVVLVLVGLLMVWVVQDHTGPPAPIPSVSSDAVLAAFGDSYLSGEGIGTFYADTNTGTSGDPDLAIGGVNSCRRSDDAYSPIVAAARGLELAFYGCSGALATSGGFSGAPDDIETERGVNSVYGQLLRWEDERGTDNDPELVLLSLGGNDAGFATIGAACFLPGSCDDALDAGATPALSGVTDRVEIALTKARELFPTSPMVVVAYPQMFGPDVDRCGGQVPFNGTETRALQGFVDALNRAVGAAVERVGDSGIVHFTGASTSYEGERFCEVDTGGALVEPAAIRSLSFQPTEGDDLLDRLVPSRIIHNTFHPTRRGHELVAAKLVEFLDHDCHLGAADGFCETNTAPVAAPGQAPPIEPSGLAGVGGPAAEGPGAEVVADAPVGGCDDLESFTQCTLIQSLRLVLVPIVLMVLAGLLLVLAAGQGQLLAVVRNRLPGLRRVIQATPLGEASQRRPEGPLR
ncbi:MAG: SGNH/GDSL hydrolase family protein [Acidimicrobiales bacterium]